MSLFFLFLLFMYIGFCTIGGGLVAITLMKQELIPRGLISPEQFYSMIAISESTPGPIGINMATYVGYELYGVLGGIVLSLGIVLPSLLTIILIIHFSEQFKESMFVKKCLYGLRAGALGMISVAALHVLLITVFTLDKFKNTFSFRDLAEIKSLTSFCILAAVSFLFKKIHPVFIILAGAVTGVLFL